MIIITIMKVIKIVIIEIKKNLHNYILRIVGCNLDVYKEYIFSK